MNKKFVVIVLDGFGMRAMEDTAIVRPEDQSSSTLGSILHDFPDLKLPNLEKLGLMNAFGKESANMKFSATANYGISELMHFGADTFMGHQEIMGTLPKKPKVVPFQEVVDDVKEHLEHHGHKVEVRHYEGLRYLLVDGYCTVADNIDADVGMAYNLTAPLDYMSFEHELKIGRLVREIAKVNRVIVFGGTGNHLQDILNAQQVKGENFIGIHAANSKSYEQGYQCRHLGYGVDPNTQVVTILGKHTIPVVLIGKVADIVINEKGTSISCVPTEEVLTITLQHVKELKHGFICTNVQETDLAGHSQNSERYKELLELSDKHIGKIMEALGKEDVLLIMADHGNDPNIGHNRHTREVVPILVYKHGVEGTCLSTRTSLSDVGATVAEFFGVEEVQNGTSFAKALMK